nr:hypothetical protein [Spirochaetia bacterium]
MIEAFIQYEEIYGVKSEKIKQEIVTLLGCLNKDEIFIYLIQMVNLFGKYNASLEEQFIILSELAPKDKEENINIAIKSRKNAIFFFRGQIFELLGEIIKLKKIKSNPEWALG